MSTANNPTPNIDQRLEALTHSVELLAQMHGDNERNHEKRFQQVEKRFQQLESLMQRVVTISESLANIAGDHERRPKDLEG